MNNLELTEQEIKELNHAVQLGLRMAFNSRGCCNTEVLTAIFLKLHKLEIEVPFSQRKGILSS